jgi:hypothetical protein
MNKDTTDKGWLERCSGDALMAIGATAISWLLSLDMADVGDPEGCAGRFANFSRPLTWSGPRSTSFSWAATRPSPGASGSWSASTPGALGTNNFDLLILVEVHQKDLAFRVEVVGRARQLPLH